MSTPARTTATHTARTTPRAARTTTKRVAHRTAPRLALTLALAALLLLTFAAAALAEGFVNTHNWSTQGSLPGRIAEGAGLCVYNGQLYVSDYSNSRVQVFTTDGAYLRQWAVTQPTGIVIDPTTETVYVGSSTGVVGKYTPAGDSLGNLTTYGSGAEQVAGVEALAIDAQRQRVRERRGQRPRAGVLLERRVRAHDRLLRRRRRPVHLPGGIGRRLCRQRLRLRLQRAARAEVRERRGLPRQVGLVRQRDRPVRGLADAHRRRQRPRLS